VTVLVFTLGHERFALRADAVQRIVRAVAIAALPKAPAIVEGVVNVAGTIVPMLDVRRRFGVPPASLSLDQHFIIARAGRRMVGLRVDRATDVVHIDADAIESASLSTPAAEYVSGIAKLPDGLLVIHDLDRFLALDESAGLDGALAGETP
jgi:purine-binding chemotaxis protein CheW